jgi:uncharacterized protein (TIGR02099 family)
VLEKGFLKQLWSQRLQRMSMTLAWVFVVMGFVICMAWAAVHAFILPRVNDYKQALAEKATQSLGLPVEIGQIRNLGGWWTPWFAVQDIVIRDAQGRQALKLPQVSVAVSIYSLLNAQLGHVVLESPELSIRRDEQGKIWIAGLALPQSSGDGAGADWFFSLPEFAVRAGKITWQDDARAGVAGQTLALEQLDLVVRNFANTHQLRLDFTPPTSWGQRLSLRGRFYQLPLTRSGDWSRWRGQAYADLPWVDVSQLRQWVDLDREVKVEQGQGALRVWAQLDRGQLSGVTLDCALDTVKVQLGTGLQPLMLERLKGRLQANWEDEKTTLQLGHLQFDTTQGEHWPDSDIALSWRGRDFEAGSLQANALDISAISQINQRLPIPASWREGLEKLQPQGQLSDLQASWDVRSGVDFSAKGHAKRLAVRHDESDARWRRWPAVENLDVEFDLSNQGGQAKVQMQNGQVILPEVFQDPEIKFAALKGLVKWQKKAQTWLLTFNQMEFQNEDATGQLQGSVELPSQAHSSGIADLKGTFQNAQVNKVHKYLPNILDEQARVYLKNAIVSGIAPSVNWQVKGDLNDFPFKNNKGEFKVVAQVQKGIFDFAPESVVGKKSMPWPRLQDIEGELVFEQQSMRLQGQLRVEKADQVIWDKVQVHIDDLAHTVVQVDAQGKGSLTQVVDVVAHSAINDITYGVLEQTQASGVADYKLNLTIPVIDVDKTKVQGSIALKDSEVQFAQGIPVWSKGRGNVNFTQNEVSFTAVRGMVLGGEATLEGRLAYDGSAGALPLKIAGTMSAEGLRQARELGFIARLGQRMAGKTNYEARVGLRKGQPELLITSDLRGIATTLPAPLAKAAAASLPTRLELMLTKDSQAASSKVLQDQLKVVVGKVLQVNYLRDLSSGKTKIVRGQINLSPNAPDTAMLSGTGVNLNVQAATLDLDEWDSIQESMSGVALSKAMIKNARPVLSVNAVKEDSASMYFPSSLSIRADELRVAHRTLHKVSVTGMRSGETWFMDVNARETGGYLQVRSATSNMPAQLYARLNFLTIEASSTTDVETVMNEGAKSIPALDIIVNDLTLKGKRLGRLQIEAVNQTKEGNVKSWQLNKLNLTMPEATFTGSGVWNTLMGPERGTSLSFQMQVHDSGALLTRLGMPGLIKSGQGKLSGELKWAGSPLAFDYPTLGGKLNVEIEKGQFLKSDPGVGRLLGVLSLQALPRRLTLDFKDVLSEGFAFDFIRGDARLDKGILYTNNLQMKGVSGGALMEGSADLVNETQDLKVVITPDINAGAASLYAATINPVIGLTTYLAQLILSKSVNKAATTEFHITGKWSNPEYVKVGE